jgi:hypothetical protein
LFIVKGRKSREMQVKIKRSIPLRKLMDSCCNLCGVQASQFGFWVHGEHMAPDNTAKKLGLEVGAVIVTAAAGGG